MMHNLSVRGMMVQLLLVFTAAGSLGVLAYIAFKSL